MTTTEPKVNPCAWYELKDAALALGVDKSTVTRAMNCTDRDRSLPFKIRRSNGRRIISGQSIINFWRLTY
jgi:hypothetical protein